MRTRRASVVLAALVAAVPALGDATAANTTVAPPAAVAAKPPFNPVAVFQRPLPAQTVGLMAAAKPQGQLPTPYAGPITPAQYRTLLARLVAWKRWKMGYFYLFSTRYNAYVSSMPEEPSPEAAQLKVWLKKAAIFFDILANYEISGFITCILLLTWATPPPTDMTTAIAYYQSIKTVYAFYTWQFFLLGKDYMMLFPEAYAWVDPKVKAFYEIAETYACFYAFNEWHVSKMMSIASLTESTSDIAKARLASFYWDEAFIKTVKVICSMKLWGWSYPGATWLSKARPFIALSLPHIAFVESYWEATLATLQETATAKQSAK